MNFYPKSGLFKYAFQQLMSLKQKMSPPYNASSQESSDIFHGQFKNYSAINTYGLFTI